MRIFGNHKRISFDASRKTCEAGYASLAATFFLIVTSLMGVSLLGIVAADQAKRTNEVTLGRARYSALAGIEWAKKNLDMGESPDVTSKTFSASSTGNYDVSLNTTTYDVTSTGHNDSSNVTYTVNTSVAASCLGIDTSGAHAAGSNITNIKGKLNCLTQVILTDMKVSWAPNTGQLLKEVKFPSGKVYTGPDVASGTPIDITDYTFDHSSTPNCDLKFSGSVNGTTMTIVWTFKDKTKITTTWNP